MTFSVRFQNFDGTKRSDFDGQEVRIPYQCFTALLDFFLKSRCKKIGWPLKESCMHVDIKVSRTVGSMIFELKLISTETFG